MKVVVDANVVLALAVPLPYSEDASEKIAIWQKNNIPLFAPTLWGYEVVTALRKCAVGKLISANDIEKALKYIFTLKIQQVPLASTDYPAIYEWSVRLNHTHAYDATYMVLAEKLNATLWTADKRLVNSAKQAGITWIHRISEEPMLSVTY